ncbi:hypothetical protein ACTJJB_08690 [Chitinophaga sp. 22536]|uniref:hypothetical protein n=1 Tax=unclassified Chitinophaga TaxID=2619133 RepID=UPI003F8561FA
MTPEGILKRKERAAADVFIFREIGKPVKGPAASFRRILLCNEFYRRSGFTFHETGEFFPGPAASSEEAAAVPPHT